MLFKTTLAFVCFVGAFAACSAAGDLNFTPDPTPADGGGGGGHAILPSEEAGPLDAGSDTGLSAPSKGPSDRCEGVAIALLKEDASTLHHGRVTGTTVGLGNDYSSTCGGGSGADAVYRLDPPLTGRATARITAAAGFSALLSARSACADDKTELGCGETALSFPVFEGKPVFLFVDGYGGSNGEFTLDVDVQTAVCGNGKAESPEECDDGNTTDGDGCSSTCKLEASLTTISACPGVGYRLKAGASMSFAGDTTSMSNGGGSATGCASTGSGPNAIYAITPTVTGNLSFSLLANYPGALLHIRRECSDSATQADCVGATATDSLVPLNTNIPVFAEQTIFAFVDSSSTSNKGLFTLDASLTAAACGNGKRDGNEECDDGNANNNDGCSATCTVERDPATNSCPGKALRLDAASSSHALTVRGTTDAVASKWSSCGVSGAGDVVYQVTSDIDGWLTAKVKGGFNTTIAVRSSCPGTADLACSKAAFGNAEETVSVAINKETPLFVIVDGQSSGQSGAFDLSMTVAPSVCGNGVIEGGETCDDGVAAGNGDGCDDHCQLETDKARDTCATAPSITLDARSGGAFGTSFNSGNTNLTTAVPNQHSLSPCSSFWADAWFPFTAPISGVVTARITSAAFRSTIGIRTGCAPSGTQLTCDGTNAKGGQEITFAVNEGVTYYLAVAGGVVTSGKPEIGRFSVDVNLVPTGCGDTFVNPPEQCDDGNVINGDGCSSTCTVESLANIQACPGHPVALSGSGGEVRRATITVDTTGLPSNTGSVCGGSGPEGILVITPDIDGQLAIKASAGHAVLLHARTNCGDPASEIKKSDCGSSNLSSVNTPVTKNTPYYVFVDGQNGAAGVAKLSITVTP